jgi:curli biogenesis system outer membrane secretion channel CsgG
MLQRSFTFIVSVVLLAVCGCSDRLILQTSTVQTPALTQVKRIAVVDFGGETGGQAIADLVTINFIRAGYEVVERDQLRDVVREVSIGREGFMDLSDAEKAKIFGKILNADVIVTGELVRKVPPRYQKKGEDRLVYESATLEITARAFDARTGKVMWTAVVNGTATAKTGDQLKVMDYINEPCRELVHSFKTPGYEDVSHVYEGKEIERLRVSRGF